MKKYLDMSEADGASIFIKGVELAAAGTDVYSMSVRDKNAEYDRLAKEYDIHFIFDDHIPEIDFYTIPYINIMAVDSSGGYFGTVGEMGGIESEAPVCYISKDRKCYLAADNLKALLQQLDSWKENMTEMEDITFYKTKEDAKAVNDFVDIEEVLDNLNTRCSTENLPNARFLHR